MNNEEQKKPLTPTRWKRFRDWWTADTMMNCVFLPSFCVLLVIGVIGVGALAWSFTYKAVGDKTMRFCFIEQKKEQLLNQAILKANRGWGFDSTIGIFNTPQEAVDFAKQLDCPIE